MSTCYSTFQIPENGNWHHDENPLVLLVVAGDSNFTPDLTLSNNAWLHTGCSSIFVQNSTLGKFIFCIFFPILYFVLSILSNFPFCPNFPLCPIFLILILPKLPIFCSIFQFLISSNLGRISWLGFEPMTSCFFYLNGYGFESRYV